MNMHMRSFSYAQWDNRPMSKLQLGLNFSSLGKDEQFCRHAHILKSAMRCHGNNAFFHIAHTNCF